MRKRLIWIIGVAAILSACNSEVLNNQSTNIKEEHKTTSDSESMNFLTNEKLPALTITIGEETIQTSLGLHSLSYTDRKTGQRTRIDA